MQLIFKPLKPHGFDSRVIADGETIPDGWTNVFPPQPCWKPVFDWSKNVWIETATEEEMRPPAVIDPEPSEIELLRQENKELSERIDLTEAALLEVTDMLLNHELGGESNV